MLKPTQTYNLNAQAMDATINLIKDVFAKGINVKQIYIDTIGKPETYQMKLEHIFPSTMITVAKKADSLYPCVSAASVCAKVTRDAALEVCYRAYADKVNGSNESKISTDGWGSGYPSDSRCNTWLKENMNPIFGWGSACRFSWKTCESLLETKNGGVDVEWPPLDDGDQSMRVTDFFTTPPEDELSTWFGRAADEEAF